MKKIENQYINIIIGAKELTSTKKEEIDHLAFEKYNCLGKHCFELKETEVDEIFKEDALTSVNITEKNMNKIEELMVGVDTGYFFMKEEGMLFFNEVKGQMDNIRYEAIDYEDWNEEWKKSYKKIIVSENLSVIPSWEKTKQNKNEIYINPGMGFGTGTHETTFLCLSHLEKLLNNGFTGKRCLDFGCGSGILGIAAFKQGEMVVDFCDVDGHALENCHQNILLNDYEQYQTGHEIILRDRLQSKTYDLVFANILESVLVEESQLIKDSLEQDGIAIFSGILSEQVDTIINCFSEFKLIDKLELNNWAALMMKKQ